jgi:arginase family enzyme
MPAAAPLRAGGLGMGEVLELVQALAGRGRLGGAAVVGLVPGQDIHGEGAALTAQLLAALLGLIAGR